MATTAEARPGSGRRLPSISSATTRSSHLAGDTAKTLSWPKTSTDSASSRAINYEKIIKLLTNRHTAAMQDRHIHSLNKIVRRSAGGVSVHDVGSLATVLTTVYDQASGKEYVASVAGMLDLIRRPIIVDKISNIVVELESMPLLLSAVVKYLSSPSGVLVEHAAESLAIYNQSKNPRAAVNNAQIVTDAEIASAAAEALTQTIEPKARETLLTLLHGLAFRAKNMNQMIQVEGFCATVHCLYCRTRDNLFQATNNLAMNLEWLLLESEYHIAVANQIATEDNVHEISNYLRDSVKGAKDVPTLCQTRNDALSIYILLMESSTFCKVVTDTLCVDRLVRYCVLSDLGASHPDCEGVKLGNSKEDFELHMLMVQGLIKIALKCPESRPRLAGGGFLSLLFQYLLPYEKDCSTPGNSRPSTAANKRWSPPKYEELQLQALAALAQVLPLCLKDYEKIRGTTQLLEFLQWCCSPTQSHAVVDEAAGRTFRGAGNTFFSAGEFSLDSTANKAAESAAAGHRSHALLCLRALLNICHADTGPIRRDMIDQGLLDLLMNIVQPSLDYPTPADRLELQVRATSWSVVAVLCEYSEHAKELFGQGGVEILLPYLQYDEAAILKDENREDLLITAVDAVWSCVIGCDLTFQAFLAAEGLFALIDVLDNCRPRLQNEVLGCVLDVCLYPSALEQAPHWRSEKDENVTLAHLLLRLWHQEQRRLGVSLAEDGILAESPQPLVGSAQKDSASRTSVPATQESAAITDISTNLRSKVFLLLHSLNFGESFDSLNLTDKVAMIAIENYPTLKKGEVLLEIADELKREDVDPIEIDKECISVLLQANTDTVTAVRESQADLIISEGDQVETEEMECYSTIRVNQLASTARSETFERFIERTANHEALAAAAAEQDMLIDQSRENCNLRPTSSKSTTDHSNTAAANKVHTTTFSAKQVQVLDPV